MSVNTQQPSSQNPYLYGANADATNTATLYAPGELGVVFYDGNKKYQRVQLDSGATAANTVGVVAANELAYWVSKVKKIVTNDARFAGAGSPNTANYTITAAESQNFIAGIFRNATTAGNYTDVLQKGDDILVASNGSGSIGDMAVGDTTANTARVTVTAAGTAPVSQTVGVVRKVSAGGNITVDVDIASVD